MRNLLIATVALTAACAHSVPERIAAPEPVSGMCRRTPTDLALAVRDEVPRFEICVQLAERNPAGEYVLGFLATPSGEAKSVTLLGADLEPLSGDAPACFAAVIESSGLARSGGGECAVTVPLIVPTAPTQVTAQEIPSDSTAPAIAGWLASMYGG